MLLHELLSTTEWQAESIQQVSPYGRRRKAAHQLLECVLVNCAADIDTGIRDYPVLCII